MLRTPAPLKGALGVTMPSSLNGWQRLWVVGLVLWGVICAGTTFLLLPKTNPQLVHEWAEKKLELMKHYHGAGESTAEFKERMYGKSTDEEITHPPPAPWLKFDKTRAVPADELEAIDSRYEAAIASNFSRGVVIGKALLIWLMPSSFIYILGIGIAWIRAGFSKNERDA